jgi:NAD(P)H-dependent FMN reductase
MPPHEQKPVHVLILAGSLRQGSLNHRLAELCEKSALAKGVTTELARVAEFDSPFYDGDLEQEAGIPDGAKRFCARLKAADAVMIASPEYNASIPAVLKNLIDWVSRFRPQPLNGRQAMLMSASPSMVGGNRGLWSLRVPLEHLGARVYPDMFSLAKAHQAFAPDGRLANEVLQKQLDATVSCFLDLVEAAKHYPALKKQWVEFLGEHPDHATNRVETAEVTAV